MSVMFSGDEIINMAVKTEETGYDFYMNAKKNAKAEKLVDLFDYLAKEELKHKEMYKQLTDILAEPAQGQPIDWDVVDEYIEALVESEFFLGGKKSINLAIAAEDENKAVDFALAFEKDTLLFFYQIQEIVKSVHKPVVQKIINEEKMHIQRLLAVKSDM